MLTLDCVLFSLQVAKSALLMAKCKQWWLAFLKDAHQIITN